MSPPIVIASAESAVLGPCPITPEWILDGNPIATNKLLAASRDKTTYIVAWECTPGIFEWYYGEDETACIMYGEVFLTFNDGSERRLGKGDMVFFPGGTSCRWRVTQCVRKVAIVRKDVPFAFGLGIRAWHRLLRIAGIRNHGPLS